MFAQQKQVYTERYMASSANSVKAENFTRTARGKEADSDVAEGTENDGVLSGRGEVETDNLQPVGEKDAQIEIGMEDVDSIEVEVVESVETFVGMNELVPLRMVNEDMGRIADMTDEFSHTMDPILRMYNAAMSAATARIEIIEDEFKYRGLRSPIHHIDTRLKSAKSILGKLEKKDLELTLSSACNNIYDIAGVRAVCPYIKDVYLIRDRLMAQDDIVIMQVKDYIAEPKPNGYRSLHMVIRVPVYFMNRKQMVPVELQIRTLAMDLWASLEHDIRYKSLYQGDEVDFSDELKECSMLIYEAEEKMEKINRRIEP